MQLLTIITVHLNDFEGLAKTCASLRAILDNHHVEWIVIDGGSITQSAEQREAMLLVQNYASHFVSELDDGIYDAMNKATQLASCEYVLYLNAGDQLHSGFSFQTFESSVRKSAAVMLWCRAEVRDRTGKIYPRKTRRPFWLRYGTAVCHQAVFFKRLALGSNPYDTQYTVAGDYDLICRLYTSGERVELMNIPVCTFDLVGKSGSNKRLTLSEESMVRQKYFAIPVFVSKLIMEFKYLVWQAGTLFPIFRRVWSRFF